MTAKVVKFEPVVVGDNFRFDPDEILDKAKGRNFKTVLIVAEYEDEDGDNRLWVSSSANAGTALILMEHAKRQIVFGDDE